MRSLFYFTVIAVFCCIFSSCQEPLEVVAFRHFSMVRNAGSNLYIVTNPLCNSFDSRVTNGDLNAVIAGFDLGDEIYQDCDQPDFNFLSAAIENLRQNGLVNVQVQSNFIEISIQNPNAQDNFPNPSGFSLITNEVPAVGTPSGNGNLEIYFGSGANRTTYRADGGPNGLPWTVRNPATDVFLEYEITDLSRSRNVIGLRINAIARNANNPGDPRLFVLFDGGATFKIN